MKPSNNTNRMEDEDAEEEEFDQFDPVTRMPPAGLLPPRNLGHNSENVMTQSSKTYTPLSWEGYFDEMGYLDDKTPFYRAGTEGALIFCIHGAGHSALSFATFAKHAKGFATVVAYDLMGHGASKAPFTIDEMAIDCLKIHAIETLKRLLHRFPEKNVVVVGHSLGGSIGIRLTEELTLREKLPRLVGCVVIDVVEGTAIEALPFMNQILSDRPKVFENAEAAIKWSITSTTLRRQQSARISIPPQLTASDYKGRPCLTWKVDLKATEQHWMGWFSGLSTSFLSLQVPKLLVTAEKERLDKELMVAQMQGKFKLIVLHGVGHSVQEDSPKETARVIWDFLHGFRIATTLAEVAQLQHIGIGKFHPKLHPFAG